VIQVRSVIMEHIVISMTWILQCSFWNETYIIHSHKVSLPQWNILGPRLLYVFQ